MIIKKVCVVKKLSEYTSRDWLMFVLETYYMAIKSFIANTVKRIFGPLVRNVKGFFNWAAGVFLPRRAESKNEHLDKISNFSVHGFTKEDGKSLRDKAIDFLRNQPDKIINKMIIEKKFNINDEAIPDHDIPNYKLQNAIGWCNQWFEAGLGSNPTPLVKQLAEYSADTLKSDKSTKNDEYTIVNVIRCYKEYLTPEEIRAEQMGHDDESKVLVEPNEKTLLLSRSKGRIGVTQAIKDTIRGA